jgi:hypothetical protein
MASCQHTFVLDGSYSVCDSCGLMEDDIHHRQPMVPDKFSPTASYGVKLNLEEDYNEHLARLPPKVRGRVIWVFEKLSKNSNLRGSGKKALFAVSFMYVCMENDIAISSSEIHSKFGLDKKKLGVARQRLWTEFPIYRNYRNTISSYVGNVLEHTKINDEELKKTAEKICDKIENTIKLINYNPYAMCAAIVWNLLQLNHLTLNSFVDSYGKFIDTISLEAINKIKVEYGSTKIKELLSKFDFLNNVVLLVRKEKGFLIKKNQYISVIRISDISLSTLMLTIDVDL